MAKKFYRKVFRKSFKVAIAPLQINYNPLRRQLKFNRVSGFHRKNPQLPSIVLSRTEVLKKLTVANYNMYGCFVLPAEQNTKLRNKLELFRKHLDTNEDKTRKFMRQVFNTIHSTDEALAVFAEIEKDIKLKYKRKFAQIESEDPAKTKRQKKARAEQMAEEIEDEARFDEGRHQWTFYPDHVHNETERENKTDREDPFYIQAKENISDIGRDMEAIICPLLSDKTVPTFPIMLTVMETMAPVDGDEVNDQLLHSDREIPTAENGIKTEPEASVGLASLQDKTLFRAILGSHIPSSSPPIHASILTMNAFDILVCHPDLIHSGMGSSEYNLRLHFYMGLDPAVQRNTNILPIINGFNMKGTMALVRAAKYSKRGSNLNKK